MDRRKEITGEYKRRKLSGGVYTITNTQSGKYILGYAANLQGVRNRFQFSVMTGATVHPKLQKDWAELGAQAFRLDILEELEQKPEQSQTEFLEDLEMLAQLWRANLDAAKEY